MIRTLVAWGAILWSGLAIAASNQPSPAPYPTHAALISAVTGYITPTISQAEYQAGMGGAATYVWNSSSYCPGGTSGSPTTADGIVCILPSTQSASTAGRYLLQSTTNGVSVPVIGMAAGGQDNSPYLSALLNAVGPAGSTYPSSPVSFPAVLGQASTQYYMSTALDWSRAAKISCGGIGGFQSTGLVFAPGVDGFIQEAGTMSNDGNWASGSDISGCLIQSLGAGSATMTNASQSVTGVSMNGVGSIPATTWGIGDGIIAAPNRGAFNTSQLAGTSMLAVPQGDYVTNVVGNTLTLNVAAAFTNGLSGGTWIYRLPASLAYGVTTTGPATSAATASWTTSVNTISVTSGNCTGVLAR